MSETGVSGARAPLLQRLEHASLLGMALVLPLLEAPKNLLWIAFAVLWLANRWRARDFGGRWGTWDTLIVLLIASGYLAAAFAGIRDAEWRGTGDILRYGSVLWLLMRGRYPPQVLERLLVCIVAGTLVALAWGWYGLAITGQRSTLGLKSVGHVNHSAIYLAITLGALLACVRAYWTRAGLALRLLGLTVLALFATSLFVMQSRGAFVAAVMVAAALLLAYSVRMRHSLRPLAIGSAVLIALMLALKPQVIEKNQALLEKNQFLSHRDGIWRAGLATWRANPLFGVGMKNYGRVGHEQLERWSSQRGEIHEASRYILSSHGHSLYVNTLAERGAFGFAVLAALLAAWLVALGRRLPRSEAPVLEWSYWGGACAAWIVAVVVGLVNTTLHHEHAMLSMLLLGGWLSLNRAR